MKYIADWERRQQRFAAFWQNELIDRCCCSITAPADKPLDATIAPPRAPKNVEERWLDAEFRYQNSLKQFNRTYFGGDAYPQIWVNLGPGVAAAWLGGGYGLADDTVWFDTKPPIVDWEDRAPLTMDWDSTLWKTVRDMTQLLCERAGGDYHVGITDIGGNLDIVASLRGSHQLLYDVYDYPEAIKVACDEVDVAWKQSYDKLISMMSPYQKGHSAWMGLWCPDTWYPLQCDFSAMLSPKMFAEFVTPWLAQEAKWVDHGVYHLDGPGQIPHLDAILAIDNIDAIQVVPGQMYQENGGYYAQLFMTEQWLPVLKKIQAAGRRLILLEVHPSEIDRMIGELSPKGLYFATSLPSEGEARDVLKRVENWR